MALTLHDMLQPQVILDVVSRIRRGQGRLGRWFGFHYNRFEASRGVLTGPNIKESPVRTGVYRIYDRVRTVAKGRAPGTGPATWQANPVGEVNYTCVRFHEKQRLDSEELSNLSKIVGPNSVVDEGGQDYITQQEGTIAERFNHAIELMTAGMIRGQWYLQGVGEDWIPWLTNPGGSGPNLTINHQIPAGNLTQLNMLGSGNLITTAWSNPAAPIITMLLNIAAAFVKLHGWALEDIWVDPTVWGYVITNTQVINTAGSANTPFDMYEYIGESDEGEQIVEWVAVLRGVPWLRWHILADVLVDQGGTDPSYSAGTGPLTQVIPTNSALFLPRVDREWTDLIHCGEFISDAPGMPMVKRPGYYFWHEWVTQPTCVELIGLLNAIPRLKIPKALALGTVVF